MLAEADIDEKSVWEEVRPRFEEDPAFIAVVQEYERQRYV